jgi:hypothetical protein
MRLTVAVIACFVLALAFSAPSASAAQAKKSVKAPSQLIAAKGDVKAIQLKDEVKPPKEDKPKKSKDGKDDNPDDGNNGGGNDDKPPKPPK